MNASNVGEDAMMSTGTAELSEISGSGARQINEALEASPRAKDFHKKAEMLLLSKSEEYLAKVGIAAVSIADQRNGATVDVPDVESAIASLSEVESKARAAIADVSKAAGLFGLGGFAAGIGATAIAATWLTSELNSRTWWVIGVSGSLLIIGILLNIWAFRKLELSRRKQPKLSDNGAPAPEADLQEAGVDEAYVQEAEIRSYPDAPGAPGALAAT
jgi:histone H3/H4